MLSVTNIWKLLRITSLDWKKEKLCIINVSKCYENMFKKKTLIVSNHYYMSKNELIVYKRLTIIILKKMPVEREKYTRKCEIYRGPRTVIILFFPEENKI